MITPLGQISHANAVTKTRSPPNEITAHNVGTREDTQNCKYVPKMSLAIVWKPDNEGERKGEQMRRTYLELFNARPAIFEEKVKIDAKSHTRRNTGNSQRSPRNQALVHGEESSLEPRYSSKVDST
jgi:hypothetical protein